MMIRDELASLSKRELIRLAFLRLYPIGVLHGVSQKEREDAQELLSRKNTDELISILTV